MTDAPGAHDPDAPATVWGIFTKAVAATEAGERDEDGEELAELAVAEFGFDGLAEGWANAAYLLLERLREHAEELGCDCGTVEWMRKVQIDLVAGDDDD